MKRHPFAITISAALLSTGAGAMELSSVTVANGGSLPADQVKTGCGGKNISPALSWRGAPPTTKSFAVTIFDPDAHGGWWHWVVVNIPASVQALAAGAGSGVGLPAGAVQGENDFGDAAYGGACPPPGSGPHHYEITVWALPDASVPFGSASRAEDVAGYLESHAIAHTEVIAVYER